MSRVIQWGIRQPSPHTELCAPGDGRIIFPNATKDGRAKGGGVFSVDFDNYREFSSADHVDDFYRLEEHVAVETDREIEWIEVEVRRFGFVWAHSATEEPHKRVLDDLYALTKKGGTKTLLQRINEAEPMGQWNTGETREKYLQSIVNERAYQLGAAGIPLPRIT